MHLITGIGARRYLLEQPEVRCTSNNEASTSLSITRRFWTTVPRLCDGCWPVVVQVPSATVAFSLLLWASGFEVTQLHSRGTTDVSCKHQPPLHNLGISSALLQDDLTNSLTE